MGIPGFFFAGKPLMFLVELFALLLFVSQLLHEAHDREDDLAGQVRTVATELGRTATLLLAVVATLTAPLFTSRQGGPMLIAGSLFALSSAALIGGHLRAARLRRLRLGYRWLAMIFGAIAFALVY
jgi:hypothetical protein